MREVRGGLSAGRSSASGSMCPGMLTAGTNPQNQGTGDRGQGIATNGAVTCNQSPVTCTYDAACTHGPGVKKAKKISPSAAELSA